jgi:hypothetical protein
MVAAVGTAYAKLHRHHGWHHCRAPQPLPWRLLPMP